MSQSTVDSYVTDRPAGRPKVAPSLPWRVLEFLASLRLTVVLFSLSLVLVLCGTLAQVDNGIKTVVDSYFHSWYLFVPLQIFFPRTYSIPGGFPFPGGWVIGGGLLINLLAAHAVRFKLSWKRAGILMLHAGVVLLLVGEFVTSKFGIEGRMTIDEGSSANFIEDSRKYELAVIDPTDSSSDVVVSVPASRLVAGETIRDDKLPFEISVVGYMANSALDKKPTTTAPATAGLGLQVRAEPKREVAGTDTEQKSDIPSAYVTIRPKGGGEPVGTYLVSLWFSAVFKVSPQTVAIGGKKYELDFRFRRVYLPYSLRLIEFRFDRYPGTNTPKNYSSQVRLLDPSRGEDREVIIRMNEPLRYGGETFYQSSFDDATEKTTVLQVVHNPGAWIPYASCFMVFIGMLYHFGFHLINFLGRRVGL